MIRNTVPPRSARLLPQHVLLERVPASRVSIWRWSRRGQFPKPVKIGGRSYWIEDEVDDFIARLAAERDHRAAPREGQR